MPAAAASWANTERLIGCGAYLEGLAWWRGWERVRFGSVLVDDGGADVDAGQQGEHVGLQHADAQREGREGHDGEGRQRQDDEAGAEGPQSARERGEGDEEDVASQQVDREGGV